HTAIHTQAPAADAALARLQARTADSPPPTVAPSVPEGPMSLVDWNPHAVVEQSIGTKVDSNLDLNDEHKSAVELADIMMSFGRLHGAAETLAEFIRGNPKQAITPWLKLLEVYRAAGLRAEFDAIANELHRTFNVNTVYWQNYDALRAVEASLEDYPHIATKLEKSWRTPECQQFLEVLLRDNRDGSRNGFPFPVIDEILLLSAILEDELGPFRPPPPSAE
ncbi:MAG TPA: hypothetical protein PKV00_03645, partial [Thauera sp.]|nr:hypothetical protein [Thauera sp.]